MFAFQSIAQARSSGATGDYPSEVWEVGTARFTAHWGRAGAVITAHGEIDAVNAGAVADHMGGFLTGGEWLVLDLTNLQFIGTDGFSALDSINGWCTQNRMVWALVPGLAAARLLRVCDPGGRLPLADSVTSALAILQDPRRLLHLVSQSRQ